MHCGLLVVAAFGVGAGVVAGSVAAVGAALVVAAPVSMIQNPIS